jgi:hypothetical protein
MYEEPKSYAEQLHEKFGWPLKIKARGCTAYLVDIQPLACHDFAPIYRFPGGDSLVSESEMVPAD